MVYNVGERVEGYTNFLWTLIIAACFALTGEPEGVFFVAVAGAAAAAICCYVLTRRLGATPPYAFLAALVPALNGFAAANYAAGLEVALFTALVVGGVAVAVAEEPRRRFYWSSVVFAVAALTRPEGAYIFGLAFLLRLIFPGGRLAPRERLAFGLRALMPFLLIYGPYFVWRFTYYGYLFPNTYYAKVGWTAATVVRGGRYMWEAAKVFTPAFSVLPALAFVPRAGRWRVAFVAAVTLGQIAFLVATGPAFLLAGRFVLPVVAVLAALSAAGVSAATRAAFTLARRVAAAALAAVLIAAVAGQAVTGWRFAALRGNMRRVMSEWRDVGLWFRYIGEPEDILLTGRAGIVAYYSRMRVYDSFGIVVPEIAHAPAPGLGTGLWGHEKGDGRVLLAKKPRFIIFTHAAVRPEPLGLAKVVRLVRRGGAKSDNEIIEQPAFWRDYQVKYHQLPSGKWLTYFERKENR